MNDGLHPLWDGEQMIGAPGECIVVSVNGGRDLRVDRADPEVRISGPLVRAALAGGPDWTHPATELTSDRLVINGINRRVIYRIGALLAGTRLLRSRVARLASQLAAVEARQPPPARRWRMRPWPASTSTTPLMAGRGA